MTEMLPGDPAVRLYPCKDPRYLSCRRPAGSRCVDAKGQATQPHGFRWAQGQAYADAYNELHPQLEAATETAAKARAQVGDLQTKVGQAAEDLVTVRQQLEAKTREQTETASALASALERVDDLEHPDQPAPDPDPEPPARVVLPFGIGINDESDNGPAGAPAGITLSPLEDAAGVKLGYARGYFTFDAAAGADKAMVAFATRHLGEGRIPLITAKVPGNDWVGAASGMYDSAVAPTAEAYMALVEKYGGQVVQGIHHEPIGDGTPANWRAMQEHYLPLVQIPGAVQQWATLEGWGQFLDTSEKTWTIAACTVPGLDGYLFDPYLSFWQKPNNNTKLVDMAKTYLDPISAWAVAHGFQWGIAETGMTEVAATKTNAGVPTWWVDFCAAARARGAGPVTYWNRYSDKGNDYRLTTTKPGNKRGQMITAMKAART